MNYLFIIVPALLVGIVLVYIALQEAQSIEEEDPFVMQDEAKFEVRKMTDLSKAEPAVVPPKKKYYKKRKKKPSVNTPVEKKPVGRPRKNTE